MHADLIEAYLQTAYCVYVEDGRKECLRIGEKSSWLDSLLRFAGQPFAVFITAENPRSKRLDHETNLRRTAELLNELTRLGFAFFEGFGDGQTPDWPPERSFLVVGMNREEGLNLAAQFDQNAYLFVRQNEPVELVWLHYDP